MHGTPRCIASFVVLLAVASPAYASHLGSQAFAGINFSDDTITSAEAEAVRTAFSDPGWLPDSPLYFIKRIVEGIRLMLTFDDSRKSELHMEFARTRLSEAKAMADKNKTQETRKAVEEFNEEIRNVEHGIGKNVSAVAQESESLDKSALVLGLVREKVPDEAKPAIQQAINNSIEKKVEMEKRMESDESDVEEQAGEGADEEEKERHMKEESRRTESMIQQISKMEKKLEESGREKHEDDEKRESNRERDDEVDDDEEQDNGEDDSDDEESDGEEESDDEDD